LEGGEKICLNIFFTGPKENYYRFSWQILCYK